MAGEHERSAQPKPSKRRPRLIWLLGIPLALGGAALAFHLWNRPPGPRGATVVSLQSLADSGAFLLQIWPADQRRTVTFLATGRQGSLLAGTAGPSGVVAKPVALPAHLSPWDAMESWHGGAVAYVDGDAGAAYLCSPWWARPRKLSDLVVPRSTDPPTWSPNGERLAVAIGDADKWPKGVRIFSAKGDLIAETIVPTADGYWSRMLWSASGRRLLLWRFKGGGAKHGQSRRRRPDAMLLSEPDWRPVPVYFPRQGLNLLGWADDDVLVAETSSWSLTPTPRITLFGALTGVEVRSLDCSQVPVGGARVIVGAADVRVAPSRGGVIVPIAGVSRAALAMARGTEYLPSRLQPRLEPSLTRATMRVWRRWPPPRVAYVYLPISGGAPETIALDDASDLFSFAISTEGTELLYVSNWELKAAPLPPEARAEAKKRDAAKVP